MANKTLIDGVSYNVIGGSTLVGGAGYDIAKGRTLIGGAGYAVPFYQPSFDEVVADMEVLAARGRNSTSTGTISAGVAATESGTVYAVLFIRGYMAVAKADVEVAGSQITITSTETLQATASSALIAFDTYQSNVIARASIDGTTSNLVYVYGATIAIVRFPSFTPTQIDQAIRAVTLTRVAGRDSSSAATIGAAYDTAARWFVAFNTDNSSGSHIAYSSPLGTVVFSTDLTNPSLLRQSGSTMYISQDGSADLSLRGGSIVAVTE